MSLPCRQPKIYIFTCSCTLPMPHAPFPRARATMFHQRTWSRCQAVKVCLQWQICDKIHQQHESELYIFLDFSNKPSSYTMKLLEAFQQQETKDESAWWVRSHHCRDLVTAVLYSCKCGNLRQIMPAPRTNSLRMRCEMCSMQYTVLKYSWVQLKYSMSTLSTT